MANAKIQNFNVHNVWKLLIMSHLDFLILAFSTNFCSIESDLSGNTVWPQALGFQNSPKQSIFGTFNKLLSTQNVNVARFARNVVMRLFLWFSNTVASW